MHLRVLVPLVLLPILFPLTAEQEQTTLEIEITNVRNSKGRVLLSVYSGPAEYPYHPFLTHPVGKDSLNGGKIRTIITGLKPGRYGLCLLDDENNSGDMEYNLLGIPKEGFGFANNVKPFLSKPDYSKCTFMLNPGTTRLRVATQYR